MSKPKKSTEIVYPPATILKLIGSWLYDFMLLCAVWLLAGIIYVIPAQMLIHVDPSQKENLSTSEFTGPVFYGYLLFITWFFFAWFWTHGGQTLGLRAWSLQLQTQKGHTLNWVQTLHRFLISGTPWLLSLFLYQQNTLYHLLSGYYQYSIFTIAFLGLLWIPFNKHKRSLYDIFSYTQIVIIPKQKKIQQLY